MPAFFPRRSKERLQFYSQRLKKPHNILKYLDFQESKIDVLARWISVPGRSPAGAKNDKMNTR
jgi:hypothetical protein